MNLQPVIPMSLNGDWNLISRTILPFNWQDEIAPGENTDFGIGDITQSFFFSPKSSDPIWGVGPVLLIPTATDELMGTEKWGAGPTGVVLKQSGAWTYGFLANHIWSYAGNDDRKDISRTFVQPFIAHTTPTAWTYTMNTEATYDWKEDEASIPLNMVVSKLVKVGNRPVSLGGGAGYWLDSPDDAGPKGWRFRAVVTFLLPK